MALETCRAAAAGGVTAFMDMPNNIPNATNRATLEAKIALAAKKTVTHHGFFVGATKDNVGDLQNVEGMDGVCGIKVFMGSSTGDLLVHEQKHLENIFSNTGGIIATHAEDENRLQTRISEYAHRTDIAAHAECRDVECAFLATKRAAGLARDYDHRLHIVHLTSATEADWLVGNKGDLITTEVCTQHLTFDQDDVEELGVRALMNPPIRYTEDKETLWKRLKDGTIDCIVTDHAPHTIEDKEMDFIHSPCGMIGLESAFGLSHTVLSSEKVSTEKIIDWFTKAPAAVMGLDLEPFKINNPAEIVVIDPMYKWTFGMSDIKSKSKNSPMIGMDFVGKVVGVMSKNNLSGSLFEYSLTK